MMVPEDRHTRIISGMAMVPRGEVGLIFAELGRISGIFNAEVHAGMVIVIAYTTLLSPFWIKLYYRMYGHKLHKDEPEPADPEPGKPAASEAFF